MSKDPVTVPASLGLNELLRQYFLGSGQQKHQGYPVVDGEGNLVGVLTRTNLLEDWLSMSAGEAGSPSAVARPIIAFDLVHREPITVFPWESCRTAAERMAEARVGRLPV